MGKQLSANFHEDEFACGCGCGIGVMAPSFIAKLQAIRDLYGKPMNVTSGLRCIAHNAAIKGHPKSRHLIGLAADIAAPDSQSLYELLKYGVQVEMTGIGIATNFIHFDLRSGTPVAFTY
jgi:uncharacterized protein YcbK (DUF882 family)